MSLYTIGGLIVMYVGLIMIAQALSKLLNLFERKEDDQ